MFAADTYAPTPGDIIPALQQVCYYQHYDRISWSKNDATRMERAILVQRFHPRARTTAKLLEYAIANSGGGDAAVVPVEEIVYLGYVRNGPPPCPIVPNANLLEDVEFGRVDEYILGGAGTTNGNYLVRVFSDTVWEEYFWSVAVYGPNGSIGDWRTTSRTPANTGISGSNIVANSCALHNQVVINTSYQSQRRCKYSRDVQQEAIYKPQIVDYFLGYPLANTSHLINVRHELFPPKSGQLAIHYYRPSGEVINDFEGIEHRVIDCLSVDFTVRKGKPFIIDIYCIPGSVTVESKDDQLKQWVLSQLNPKCLESYLPTLTTNWLSAYDTAKDSFINAGSFISIDTTPHIWAANNNIWNLQTPIPNLNTPTNLGTPNPNDPNYQQWFYNQYLKPMSNNQIGERPAMDSPRFLELYEVLNISRFVARAIKLGDFIERIANLLGYRPDDEGKIDVEVEKTYVRETIDGKEKTDKSEYGGNSWGKRGMLRRRSINRFNRQNGIESGGVVKIHDIPQMFDEMNERLDLALGLQESGAIEIKDGDRVYRWDNQLAMLKDIALSCASANQLGQKSLVSSIVTQQQSGAIIAGIGLPTVMRSTNVAIDGKLQPVPYWSIAPQHSIARKIDTCTYNVGLVLGQLV
jgi:hypothetical protein